MSALTSPSVTPATSRRPPHTRAQPCTKPGARSSATCRPSYPRQSGPSEWPSAAGTHRYPSPRADRRVRCVWRRGRVRNRTVLARGGFLPWLRGAPGDSSVEAVLCLGPETSSRVLRAHAVTSPSPGNVRVLSTTSGPRWGRKATPTVCTQGLSMARTRSTASVLSSQKSSGWASMSGAMPSRRRAVAVPPGTARTPLALGGTPRPPRPQRCRPAWADTSPENRRMA